MMVLLFMNKTHGKRRNVKVVDKSFGQNHVSFITAFRTASSMINGYQNGYLTAAEASCFVAIAERAIKKATEPINN